MSPQPARILVSASGACVLALFVALAHAQAGPPASAAEALAPFKRDLMAALQAGLAEGPESAIGACRLRAPEIAQARSQHGIRLGRTSHRLRNPANAGPDWVRPILDAYLADPAKRAPRSTPLPGGRTGYVEPILAQPLCLTCHGKAIAPDVAARIAELYPADEAVGFEDGDLRGVFWVEMP